MGGARGGVLGGGRGLMRQELGAGARWEPGGGGSGGWLRRELEAKVELAVGGIWLTRAGLRRGVGGGREAVRGNDGLARPKGRVVASLGRRVEGRSRHMD